MTVHGRLPESRPEVSAASVARAVSWVAVGHAVSQAAWFGSLVVIATLVAPQAFGTFTAGIVVIGVAMLLLESGTRGTIVVTRELTRAHLRTSFVLNTGVGLALAAVLAVGAGPLLGAVVDDGDPDVLRALGAGLVLNALSIVPLALLQRELLFKRQSAAVGVAAIIASVVAVGWALLGGGVWALVARQLVYGVLVAAFAWWAVRDVLPRPDPAHVWWRGLGRREGPRAFLVHATAVLVALNVDYVIVGNATGARELGLYSLAFMLAFAPLTNVSWKIGAVLFPALSATGDLALVAARTLRALRLTALALLPLLAPAVLLAPSLLPALLGDEWRPMVTAFQLLVVAGIGHAIVNIIGESLSGTGNIKVHAALQVLMCIVLIPLMVVLVDADGLRGAGIAHLIVLLVVGAGYVVAGSRRLGLRPADPLRALAPVAGPVALQALAGAGLLAALDAAGVDGLPGALLATIAGTAIAVAVFRTRAREAWAGTMALVRGACVRATA